MIKVTELLEKIKSKANSGSPVKVNPKELEYCLHQIKSGRLYEIDYAEVEKQANTN